MNTHSKKDRGFTLVELLIVIVILGILATVTVFAVRGITDKGQENACSADEKTLEVALEAWYALPPVDRAEIGTADGIPTEAELVAAELIRDESDNYNVAANGIDVTPDVNGDCYTAPAPTT